MDELEAYELRCLISEALSNLTSEQLLEFIAEVDTLCEDNAQKEVIYNG